MESIIKFVQSITIPEGSEFTVELSPEMVPIITGIIQAKGYYIEQENNNTYIICNPKSVTYGVPTQAQLDKFYKTL